jgi:hypothetical protein
MYFIFFTLKRFVNLRGGLITSLYVYVSATWTQHKGMQVCFIVYENALWARENILICIICSTLRYLHALHMMTAKFLSPKKYKWLLSWHYDHSKVST